MVIVVFYEDDEFEYSNTVFHGHVQVIDNDQSAGVQAYASIILSTSFLWVISFVIFVKIRERMTGIPENKRKRIGPNPGLYDRLREIISA